MPRRRSFAKPRERARPLPAAPATSPEPGPSPSPRRRLAVGLAVSLLLASQWSLAVLSLIRENPTVDEVVHLPAGVSYWQRGTFRLYPHNPPLIKLIAALPVVAADPVTEPLYQVPPPGSPDPGWGWSDANKAAFAHGFMLLNADRLFELFTPARLLMPAFAVLGGLVVWDWSRRLWGHWGGLLSLTLWTFCPNVLAHARLVTTDVGATAIGFAATYTFWHYLRRPSWALAALAGSMLGIAQLTKFSLLLLYGLWPILWLVDLASRSERWRAVRRAIRHGVLMVVLSVLVINVGYGFEGVGKPLGDFPFVSGTLTVNRDPPIPARPDPKTGRPKDLYAGLQQYRVNRFRETFLADLPAPLPEYYLRGFDDQKMEAEGIPAKAILFPIEARAVGEEAEAVSGYPVFLDGELSDESWWYYYFAALAYKVPEGTWALVLAALLVAAIVPRARARPVDEVALAAVPLVVLGVMSFATNIAIGLRYVLPIVPYVFVSAGRLAQWAEGLGTRNRRAATAFIGLALTATAAGTALIHPHYLAYFNWASGGARNGSRHLIDSNLDWGQDLISLKAWIDEHAGDEPVGIAYFGQISPQVFALRGEPLNWYLPPAQPGGWDLGKPASIPRRYRNAPGTTPEPGLYAVSASLLRGLPWRVYDSLDAELMPRLGFVAYEAKEHAFSYFEELEPIDRIGHSIFVYRLTEADAHRLARRWRTGEVSTALPSVSVPEG